MNKRNLKLIMELIFIFILPLLFICFTSEIQIERNFEYDNNGNYETSIESKNLSFDNSIIKYTKTESITTNTFTHNNFEVSVMTHLYGDIYIATNYNNEQLFYGETPKKGMYTIYINSTELYFNNDGNIIASYVYDEIITINNNNYYKYVIDNHDDIYLYPFEDIYTDEGYNTLSTTTETITTNTIWGNIKELLVTNLELNDNVLIDIVLCYMILWVINWIIWHIFYGFLELLIHIIPRKWERD